MNTHILLIENEIGLAHFLMTELCDPQNVETTSSQAHKTGLHSLDQPHNVRRFLMQENPSNQSCGYQVTVVHSGIEGLIAARELHPDLIILDADLPDMSGLEICRRLRATRSEVALILIGDGNTIGDRVLGLDAGADDYVLKPFHIQELLARVRSRLRRSQLEADPSILHFEDLTLNRATREVHRCSQVIELTSKEFDLLEYFMTHPRQVMTRQQILDRIWHHHPDIDPNIVEVYIRYLRLKLEAHHKQRLLYTVRSVGYVLRETTFKEASPTRLALSAA